MAYSSAAEEVSVEIPYGGPIYISDMVGSHTNISEFQSSVEDELKDLRKELSWDLIETHRHEISVGELKILSEEDLVNIAVEASFKDGNVVRNSSSLSEGQSNGKLDNRRLVDEELPCLEDSGREIDVLPLDAFPKGPQRKVKEGTSKKRKGVLKDKTCGDEDGYIAEVEKLARVKQKQEEDKSAARLHCFDGSTGVIMCTNASSEKKERLSSFKCKKTSFKVSKASACEQMPIHGPETLLCVEVYHSRRTWVKTQEILVLGQQALTEMRDKIQCLTDEIMRFHELYDPSGYFLIEDIFYNDLREPHATDYSKPILDWLKESEEDALEKWECILSGELQQKQKKLLGDGRPKLPQLKSRPMQATCFRDLNFRLGAGYLYCHQGDCKHVIVIRDMRLIRPDDVLIRAAYPLVIFQSRLRFLKCFVCNIYKARYVTVNDKGAPKNPCYFCKHCYYMLHYQDSKLLYDDFIVYDYLYEY